MQLPLEERQSPWDSRPKKVIALAVVFIVCLVMQIALRRVFDSQDCDRKMLQIGYNCQQHLAANDRLPNDNAPLDPSTHPCSWRVITESIVFRDYHRDEPWNGPNNSKLQTRNYSYRCLADHHVPKEHTSYVAIDGKATAFSTFGAVTEKQIKQNAINTILFVEMHESGINWMEPRDISIDQAIQGITRRNIPHVQGHRSQPGTFAVFADGNVRWINSSIDPKLLRSYLEVW